MSSIYRKGRDGYFYYQTYVLNPETGLKNKRIFHSLNTKDREEALIKKKQLDDSYQNKTKKSIQKNQKKRWVILSFLGLSFLLLFFLSNDEPGENTSVFIADSLANSLVGETKNKLNIQSSFQIEDSNIFAQQDQVPKISKDTVSHDIAIGKHTSIPSYNVIRVEGLSGVFEQGKIYAVINDSTSIEQMLILCKSIRSKYAEYPSIVICLYSDNKIGLEIANGNGSNISRNDITKHWRAMYSYHEVEGEYFDDNPGGYLGF